MTRFATASFLLAGLTRVAAQTTPLVDGLVPGGLTTSPGPRIEFAEPVHDFGKVEYGRVLTNFFVFTNTGDRPLEIKQVISSCGCVAAQNWDRGAEPGKTGTIPVIFTASGIGEDVTKPIRIVCNDPTQSNAVIYIHAVMYKPIDAVPGIAAFTFGPNFQTNETRVIRLVSNMDEPVSLSDPVCTNRSFRAELSTVKPGKEFELRVTVVPPLGPGGWVAPITMKTSSAKMPVVSVSGYAMVQPALTVEPPRIFLPAEPAKDAANYEVTIQNNSTNVLVLSEPTVNALGAAATLREVQPGRLFSLTVSFPAGFQARRYAGLEVRVKSNEIQSPVIRVPCTPEVSLDDDAPAGASEAAPSTGQVKPPANP
jgi:hypothetical protein